MVVPNPATFNLAGLTIVGFFGSWLVLWLPFAIPCALKLKWRPFQPSTTAQKLPLLAGLYLLAPLTLGGINWLEGKTFADYGMRLHLELLSSLSWGLIAGSSGLLALFLLQFWLGWLQGPAPVHAAEESFENILRARTHLQTALPNILLALLLGLWVGWTEELIFRGFLQEQLQQMLPVWPAASIASLFFALLHGVWQGKAVVPQLPGLWLMGMVLVLSRYIDQGNLGLAWGLHAGWVWTIASLDMLQLTHSTGKVPTWVTGVDGQALAGVVGLLFLLATAAGLGWLG